MAENWNGPPIGYFAEIIPVQRVAARSDVAVVVLVEVRCYRQGILFELVAATARTHPTMDNEADQFIHTISPPMSQEEPRDEFLRFYVSGPGITASSADAVRFRRQAMAPGDGEFVLNPVAGRGRFGPTVFEYRQPLWLSPLPPPQPFDLVTEWPAHGIADSRFTLDGQYLVRAAENSSSFWPMSPPDEPGVEE
ncbi:hypothetical protein [Kibdelosporangium aridum]|uniref:Uncharacterized protein n=1 Tax=Kibdelosporangium aridum TaxID=2030 RepID=A0A1W2FGH3_KIBAR|nr:hypothetical protein [Kibdelosporangium aridum]SMD20970.1 hypothetical protein SAMN05661093_06655 [Kibdelosporangium aridum]